MADILTVSSKWVKFYALLIYFWIHDQGITLINRDDNEFWNVERKIEETKLEERRIVKLWVQRKE